VAGGEAYYIMV
jgi:hypothetical protein